MYGDFSDKSGIRYGENPYPYGSNYDMGIDIYMSNISGVDYLSIKLHETFMTIVEKTNVVDNTVHININIFSGSVTNKIVSVRRFGDVIGVVAPKGVVAIFPITRSGGYVDVSPETVFDDVVDPDSYASGLVSGLLAGTPIYYFVWNPTSNSVVDSVKRCLYEPDISTGANVQFGVYLAETSPGNFAPPVPAIFSSVEPTITLSISTILNVVKGTVDKSLQVGDIDVKHHVEILNGIHESKRLAGRAPMWDGITTIGVREKSIPLSDLLPNVPNGGWFFPEWYDSSLGVSASGQNGDVFRIDETSRVFDMSGVLIFDGNTAKNYIDVRSEVPVESNSPTILNNISLSITDTPISKTDVSGTNPLTYIFGTVPLATGEIDGSKLNVFGGLVSHLEPGVEDVAIVSGHPVPDGLIDGEVLTWDDDKKEWYPTLPEQGHMPPGEDQNTMFYDEEVDNGEGEDPGAWLANKILLWQKGKVVNAQNVGNRLVFDFSELALRPWDADMPGIVFRHPDGGVSGLFANIESGANSGDRLDMGFGGAGGGNFEIYGNDHGTRSGQFRVIVGQDGHWELKVHQGGTSWKTVAGISKEGRFVCGFNDTGFPGGGETYGTYPKPQHPFQVYDEEDNDSQVVAHITKEGVLKLRAEIGGIERDVTIDLGDIAEENEEAISVKLRETYVLEMEDGKLVGKKRMILCSESYGDPESVGSSDIGDGTAGQVLRWDDGEWKPTTLDQKEVVVDVEYSGGEFTATSETIECFVKPDSDTTKTVFETVEGAGKVNTATTLGHTHD